LWEIYIIHQVQHQTARAQLLSSVTDKRRQKSKHSTSMPQNLPNKVSLLSPSTQLLQANAAVSLDAWKIPFNGLRMVEQLSRISL
jgi:hypothetical protein